MDLVGKLHIVNKEDDSEEDMATNKRKATEEVIVTAQLNLNSSWE